MIKPKVGLLPLYIALYDEAVPERRPDMEAFYDKMVQELEERDMDVVRSPICRLEGEFKEAITYFETEGAEAIVTLHLAYSPSLESAAVLAATDLPIIVLDTTPDFDFSPVGGAGKIMFNHGIHGVMDMCNLLRRNDKEFLVEAGHWEESDVLDRVVSRVRGACMAARMRRGRVGLIGTPFEGMGDFIIPFDVMQKTLGISVVPASPKEVAAFITDVDEQDIQAEIEYDLERFDCEGLDEDVHGRSVLIGMVVRHWLEQQDLNAFSINFLNVDKASGLPAVPFLEAGKAMARGIGYAGEGDVLTASFVAALAAVVPETTFTEMFCPDWKNDSVFLSHMGEVNVNILDAPRLIEKPFPYTDAENPVAVAGCYKGGSCIFANLAPGPDNTYSLILVPGEMLEVKGEDGFQDSVRGWFKPELELPRCLEQYSRLGGTHHAALLYTEDLGILRSFGQMMGWNVVEVK